MLWLRCELAGKSRLWLHCVDCPYVCSFTHLTHRIEINLKVVSETGHINYYSYYCVVGFQAVHHYGDWKQFTFLCCFLVCRPRKTITYFELLSSHLESFDAVTRDGNRKRNMPSADTGASDAHGLRATRHQRCHWTCGWCYSVLPLCQTNTPESSLWIKLRSCSGLRLFFIFFWVSFNPSQFLALVLCMAQ